MLEIVYFLNTKHNELQVEKFSIQTKVNLFLKKNDAVNTDFNFYTKLKDEFDLQTTTFYLNEPLFMDPVFIPKPWGQEIWYTGVEKRGVSQILTPHSIHPIPQPWFFAALPKTMLGEKYSHKNLVLVKILDPLPQEVTGDLYYELHQEKNEVYVVTEISTDVGRIKMGISQKKLDEYKNDFSKLKDEFLGVIEKYEIVRRKIDAGENSKELLESEIHFRKAMDEFAGYLDLQVGDVIAVPILLPHALQHGVRVIEFQTPTYERLIISFAQKVLTQNHWDTKLALQLMEIHAPKKTELAQLFCNENYQVELVCSFQDFYSVRVTLKKLREYPIEGGDSYKVLFLVKGNGELQIKNKNYYLEAGRCIFIPAHCLTTMSSQEEMSFLICAPEKF